MNILILSPANVASQVKAVYDASSYKYHVTICSNNLGEAKKNIDTATKQLVAVIDVSQGESTFVELEPLLRNKRMKIIVMVKNVKDGFDYLSRGAHEMVVLFGHNAEISRQFGSSLISKTNKLFKEYDIGGRTLKQRYESKNERLIVIGASTGGTEIILKILKSFPKNAPPVLIVQHMPPVFTKMYAQRLNNSCPLSVWEAQDGDVLQSGLALLAPGSFQMRLSQSQGRYSVSVTKEPPYSGHAPSVDLLFNSVSKLCAKNTIGVILTGMGADGAEGLLNLRKAGAYTLGQDEPTSIVYGMPKVAYDMGAVMKQGSPDEIAQLILAKI